MKSSNYGTRHQPKLQLLLKSDIAQHQQIPKEYNMDISDPNVQNTFVFTEQDLPGYASKNKAKADALARGIPTHLLREKNPKPNSPQPFERGKRGAPQYRRGIPSEFSCLLSHQSFH